MPDQQNFQSTNHCSTIRRSVQTEKERLTALEDALQQAGQRVDETQQAVSGTVDPAQEQTLRAEADAAIVEARRLEAEVERAKQRVADAVNNYTIDGCQDILGPL